VVSAVGHEVDFTIADFVADLRAATPSAAAELLVPDTVALQAQLARGRDRAGSALERRMRGIAQRLDLAQAQLAAQQPAHKLATIRARLGALQMRLDDAPRLRLQRVIARLALMRARLDGGHPRNQLALRRQGLANLRLRLQSRIGTGTEGSARRLALLARALNAVSPLATLARGYAIVRRTDGSLLTAAEHAPAGTPLRIQLARGELDAESRGPRPKT
jgi:exodeoxyribonuclease VII large subunit